MNPADRFDWNKVKGSIDEFCREDEYNISDFFELLQPEDEFADDRYSAPEIRDDVAKISEGTPHPKVVMDAIRKSVKRVYFGTFLTKKVEFQTCIVDKDLYIWPVNDPERIQKVSETDYITAIGCGARCKKVTRRKLIAMIVVASGKSISIIPVTNQGIAADVKHKEWIGFSVTSIAVNKKGTIFLGSASGIIYQLRYELNENLTKSLKFTVTRLSDFATWMLSWVPLIDRNFSSAILEIVYDDTTSYMATLDARSHVEFYKYEQGKLVSCGSYEVMQDQEKEGRDKSKPERVVTIKAIPYGYSKVSRFIAFTNYGSRHIIGKAEQQIEDMDKLCLIKKRDGPSYFDSRELVDAGFTLNYFTFVFRDSIVVTKPVIEAHRFCTTISPEEDITIFQLPASGLVFNTGVHSLMPVQSKFFHSEMVWQHLVRPGSGYLVTSAGTHLVTFATPVDCLARIMARSPGLFTQEIHDWMDAHRQYSESIASLMLLGGRSNDQMDHVLKILTQFDGKHMATWNRRRDGITYVCAGFILRIARLLSPMWACCLFTESGGQYEVNDIYSELPDNMTDRIEKVIEIMEKYIRRVRLLLGQETDEDEEDITKALQQLDNEAKIVQRLVEYLQCVIQLLSLVKIIQQQKRTVVHQTVEHLKTKRLRHGFSSYMVLVEKAFGESEIITYSQALREFAAAMFHIPGGPQGRDKLAHKLAKECPLLFCEADLKVIDQLDKIKGLTMDGPVGERDRYLKDAKDDFLGYIQHLNTDWDLHTDTFLDTCREICTVFKKFRYFDGIIQVTLNFARALDPSMRGLQWYKEGRRADDKDGMDMFDKDAKCYALAFDILDDPAAFELILKTGDELFHIFVYMELYEDEKRRERLVSVSTPYIVEFLECWDKEKDLLWRYYARHNEYGTAATRLLRLAKDNTDNGSLGDRIDQLLKVTNFARASGLTTTLRQAQSTLTLAQIQQDYCTRHGIQNEKLMPPQELFDKCCEEKFWDLVLQLLSCCKVDVFEKRYVIARVWFNMFLDQIWHFQLPRVGRFLYDIITRIGPESEVCDPELIVPVLEEYRIKRAGTVKWLITTLLECGIQKHRLIRQYLNMISQFGSDEEAGTKCDFIFAVALLLDKGAALPDEYKAKVSEYRQYYRRVSVMPGYQAEDSALDLIIKHLV